MSTSTVLKFIMGLRAFHKFAAHNNTLGNQWMADLSDTRIATQTINKTYPLIFLMWLYSEHNTTINKHLHVRYLLVG